MIEKLKKVELQDKNILEQYLIKCNRILCDFNFVNIFSWRNVFNTQWLFFDNTPVIYNAADDLILMPC
ncbi:MAG TPA: hypothetical protein PLJ38_07190, partial [bacterium]|nr:hypothetical protein [bacterium]